MFEQTMSIEERYEIIKDVALVGLLFVLGFVFNQGMRISGLYMDDLYMWSCYGEQTFTEFVFPVGTSKFRPVYWLLTWIELGLISNHITWIVPINILFSGCIVAILYFFAKKISNSRIIALLVGVMFSASRFSYYNIGQLLGLMEALGLLFAILTFIYLYRFMVEDRKYDFFLALIFYFLNCFTHERYMVLLPLFVFVLVIRKEKRIQYYIALFVDFLMIQLIRWIFIGTVLPSGTGGTDVIDTASAQSIFTNVVEEILYLFGINTGPEHLAGITWEDTEIHIKFFICIAVVLLVLYGIQYVITLIKCWKNLPRWHIPVTLLLCSGIGGTILSSAVTIRVEMRWIYAPYMFGLLLLAHMYSIFPKIRLEEGIEALHTYIPLVLLCLWVGMSVPVECYGHAHYDKIYLFPNQKIYNSLADETYGKYGVELADKQIYIIGNAFEMSDFTADTFFKVFEKEWIENPISVTHVESVLELGQIHENMIVLAEDTQFSVFHDVTDTVRSLKCDVMYGYYTDGWMDEEAKMYVMTGKSGKIVLEIMYPGEITGKEVMLIEVLGEVQAIDITQNVFYHEISARPYNYVELMFSNNFYIPDALEQRGEKKLSVIVNITTE